MRNSCAMVYKLLNPCKSVESVVYFQGRQPVDPNNPVIKLCIEGSRAEFEGRPHDARDLYQQAWSLAADDFERCIAAHYVARFQDTPQQTLAWNLESLRNAEAVDDERVEAFYPSLYVNLGHSYEVLGEVDEAQRFYDLAAASGVIPARRVGDAATTPDGPYPN